MKAVKLLIVSALLLSANLAADAQKKVVEDPDYIYTNVDEKLATQFNAKNRPALYYIAIGNSDFLYKDNMEYKAKLEANGYPFVYKETDGGHIWRNWRIYLDDFAPRLFK